MNALDDCIEKAKRIVVVSGAGLSEASGIPTYRGKNGLWEKSVITSESAPEEVTAFFKALYAQFSDALPNAGHYAFAEADDRLDILHVTQNVDGLLQVAGCRNVIEIHGTMHKWFCSYCGCGVESGGQTPCPSCGSETLRPDVVLFGEGIPRASLDSIYDRLTPETCDLLIVAGTSSVVYPVAQIVIDAHAIGIPVLTINPEKPTHPTSFWIKGTTQSVLPELMKEFK